MNIKQFLEKTFSEMPQLENIDLTEGSNFYDLVVVPITEIIEEQLSGKLVDEVGDRLDLGNYKDIDIEQLKILARNHIVTLRDHIHSSGNIRLFFTSPTLWEIEKGTEMYAEGVRCTVDRDVSIGMVNFPQTPTNGLYECLVDIPVTSEKGNIIKENTIGRLSGAPNTLAKITHPAFFNGVQEYTHDELYNEIRNTLSAAQGISEAGIKNAINQKMAGLRKLQVVGNGDPAMKRDVIVNFMDHETAKEQYATFNGKLKGVSAFCNNSAYADVLSSSNPTGNITGREISQNGYISINEAEEGKRFKVTTGNIFNDNFDRPSMSFGMKSNITDISDEIVTVGSTDGMSEGDSVEIHCYKVSGTSVVITATAEQQSGAFEGYYELTTESDHGLKLFDEIQLYGNGTAIYTTVMKVIGDNDIIIDKYYSATQELPWTNLKKVEKEPVKNGVIRKIVDENDIELYLSPNIDFTGMDTVVSYLQVVGNEEISQIGNGWVLSEGGFGIGKVIRDDEATVRDGVLVLGVDKIKDDDNIMYRFIESIGMQKFLQEIRNNVKAKIIEDEATSRLRREDI